MTYSYDSNPENGTLEAAELYGYRLQNNAIEMRISGSSLAQASDCTHGTWLPITINEGNESVEITDLAFAKIDYCDNVDDTSDSALAVSCASIIASAAASTGDRLVGRSIVTISVAARPIRDDSMIKQSTAAVYLPNDVVRVVP